MTKNPTNEIDGPANVQARESERPAHGATVDASVDTTSVVSCNQRRLHLLCLTTSSGAQVATEGIPSKALPSHKTPLRKARNMALHEQNVNRTNRWQLDAKYHAIIQAMAHLQKCYDSWRGK